MSSTTRPRSFATSITVRTYAPPNRNVVPTPARYGFEKPGPSGSLPGRGPTPSLTAPLLPAGRSAPGGTLSSAAPCDHARPAASPRPRCAGRRSNARSRTLLRPRLSDDARVHHRYAHQPPGLPNAPAQHLLGARLGLLVRHLDAHRKRELHRASGDGPSHPASSKIIASASARSSTLPVRSHQASASASRYCAGKLSDSSRNVHVTG